MGLLRWFTELVYDANKPVRQRKHRMMVVAGVGSVQMRCHADTWRVISEEMWRQGGEMSEERVTELADGLVEVTLSGPHLMTLVEITAPDWRHLTDAHRAMAQRVYRQVSTVIDAIDPDAAPGKPIPPIILDDKLGEKPI